MKLFKKPVFAFVLAAVVVVASTLLSVNIKLGNDCQVIIDSFYDGVYLEGERRPAIADQLKLIRTEAEEIADYAEKHGLDVEELRWCCDDLRLGLLYSPEEASYLYYCYDEMLDELKDTVNELEAKDPGRDTLAAVAQSIDEIAAAQSLIDASGYNESVREFSRMELNALSEFLGELAGVDFPEQFS